jgi:PTS system ascorbate-specific IIB component
MKKIVVVCGHGIGTSVLLKINAEKVLAKIGEVANVEAADLQTAHAAAQTADIFLTSADIASQFTEVPADHILVINNFTDLNEIESKLAPIFK